MSAQETAVPEATASASDGPSLGERLQVLVGQSTGPSVRAWDPVNQPMIRHWVEAMGDHNPVYVDDAAARDAGPAPTAMCRGLRQTTD